jgi:hypothetical protein
MKLGSIHAEILKAGFKWEDLRSILSILHIFYTFARKQDSIQQNQLNLSLELIECISNTTQLPSQSFPLSGASST